MINDVKLEERQKQFRASGIVFFFVAISLLGMRLLVRYLSPLFVAYDDATQNIIIEVIFDFGDQIVCLLFIPLLIYKFYLNKPIKDIFRLSSFRRTDKRVYFLSFLLGCFVIIVTIGVSYVWQIILSGMGYDGSSSNPMPATFQWWHLVLMLVITAVFPAVCEEFVNRGILLGALRNSFSEKACIVLCGVIFGLFHQYISQTVYTMLFGMLLAYLVIRTRSIIPGCIIHFTNNALSTVMQFVDEYAPNFSPYAYISNAVINSTGIAFLCFFLALAACYIIVRLIVKCSDDYYTKNYTEFLRTGNDEYLDKVTTQWTAGDVKYKPTLRDSIFYIGAIFITVIYTIFTFYWGLF